MKPKIIFLNQMSGKLFRELAEDISLRFSPAVMFTGQADSLKADSINSLRIYPAPGYKRKNNLSRFLSWIHYFVYVFIKVLFLPRTSVLFLVSNPPFLGLLGLIFKIIRRQKYVILVYDIYPDVLVQFGKLNSKSFITSLWRRMNKRIFENSEIVFTIGEKMAENLGRAFSPSKTPAGDILSIHNWADTEWIKPVLKKENPFAQQYGQVEKLTVLYSGNFGKTHDIETILEAALQLEHNQEIHFMFIGAGDKKLLIKEFKKKHKLENITVLPFQPEHVMPNSLTTGEIAVISLGNGSEGLMVPSKTYPSMAAGSALLGLCVDECEVANIITEHDCGFVISPGDVNAFVNAIEKLANDRGLLRRFQVNSREAVVRYYSRKNTAQYIVAISKYIYGTTDVLIESEQ